jgi:hypothetical protein
MYITNKVSMRALYIIIFLGAAFPFMLAAQIKGIVVDESGMPLSSVNIVLLDKGGNATADGTASDEKGRFVMALKAFKDTTAVLGFSHIGYKEKLYEVKLVRGNVDIGKVTLIKAVTELGEVTVSASRTITQVDKRIFFPQKFIVKNSTDGYTLLNHLMLSGLRVDIVQKKVSKNNGGNVAVYIDDKLASKADLLSLQPDEVLRVEYIDSPGVQYADDNVEAVVNLVMKRRYSGVVAGANTTNAATTGKGENSIYAKYNYKLSEFTLQYDMEYSKVKERYINQEDRYILQDETDIFVNRMGINTKLKYMQHNIELMYNLSKPKAYIFETKLTGTFYDSPDRGHKQYITETNKPAYYSLTNPTEKFHRPVLNMFYRHYLPQNQIITANVVGTYINTRNGQSYKEYSDGSFKTPFNEYEYYTSGEKYSLISEARYNKKFKVLSFLIGLKHLQAHTRNEYTGTGNAINQMTTANSYLYSQISGKSLKFSYIVGLGGNREYYRQDSEKYNYWLLRPSLTVSYAPSTVISLKYGFSIAPNIPSLASLSNVSQRANEWDVRTGNPGLKPYATMTNYMQFIYKNDCIDLENTTNYSYSHNPIMESINRIADHSGNSLFEFGYDNHKRLDILSNNTGISYTLIPEKLVFQTELTLSRAISKGKDYSHSLNYMQGGVEADLYLGKLSVGGGYKSGSKSLMGETVYHSMDYSIIYAYYNLKNVTIGFNWSYLFHSVNDYEKTENKYVTKQMWVNVPDFKNMLSISLSINLNRGRMYKAQGSVLQNSDTDSGAFKY